MTKTFVISDTHFGHAKILTFKMEDGSPVREFASVEEMDDVMVERWNAVVGENDKVYHLGDVAIGKKDLKTLARLNGRKTLISGNHDCHNTKEYLKYFDNVRGYRVLNTQGGNRIILSHIPIDFEQRGRFSLNVHGHLHRNVKANPFYYNVSVEQINYTPLDVDIIFQMVDNIEQQKGE